MSKKEMREVTIYNFSLKNFAKRTVNFGKKVRRFVKEAFDFVKDLVKTAFVFLHEKLSDLEDYILAKFTSLGNYAEEKLNERIEELTE